MPEVELSESELGEEMSIFQSISASSMGTSSGCQSCMPKATETLTGTSMDTSGHRDRVSSSSSGDHIDTERTSLLLRMVEATAGEESETEVKWDVEGVTEMVLVVPLGVV